MENIAVLDLGVANVFNVVKAVDGFVAVRPEQLEKAGKIIIPGVGNFSAVVNRLNEFRNTLMYKIRDSTPVLGICLGFHILFETSDEGAVLTENKGLGLIKGGVRKFEGIRIPHMGWNQIQLNHSSPLFEGLKSGDYFYFVHSYYPETEESECVSTYTEYGEEDGGKSYSFASSVCKGSVFGVQFHPEKSGENGRKLLENFKRIEVKHS